jgi:hypothetical protein
MNNFTNAISSFKRLIKVWFILWIIRNENIFFENISVIFQLNTQKLIQWFSKLIMKILDLRAFNNERAPLWFIFLENMGRFLIFEFRFNWLNLAINLIHQLNVNELHQHVLYKIFINWFLLVFNINKLLGELFSLVIRGTVEELIFVEVNHFIIFKSA